jgi:hypothetical protein
MKTKSITATLNGWANALGKDPDTLRRALSKRGHKPTVKGQQVSARIIFAALTKESEDPKQRLLLAHAVEQERENQLAEGRICAWEDVQALLQERLVGPMTAALDAAPKDIDREWVEKVLKPALRQKLTAPKPGK